MLAEIVVIFFLLVVNALLSGAEMSLSAARESRLLVLARGGSKRALKVLSVLENPSQFLSSIQMGVSLVAIFTGAYGGATMAEDLATTLARSPLIEPYAGAVSFVVVFLFLSYVSIVLGELVPKRLGLAYPETLAMVLVPPILALSGYILPILHVLSWSTEKIVQYLIPDVSEDVRVTEEEIKVVVSQGAAEGVIEQEEEQIVRKALSLGDRKVESLMTPRTDLVWLDIERPLAESWSLACNNPHSQYPVCQGEVDKLLGIVTFRDLASFFAGNLERIKETAIIEPLKVSAITSAIDMLKLMRARRKSYALVIDEHGGVDGVVTMKDLLGSLVGELEPEEGETSVRKREDGSYAIDGWVDIKEVSELLCLPEGTMESGNSYCSLGGFMMKVLERIPKEGDVYHGFGYEFEVVDMDGHRVDKVLIKRALNPAESDLGGGI